MCSAISFTTQKQTYGCNISHNKRCETFEKAKKDLVDKITLRGDLSYITVSKQLALLEELSEFPLGQFLVERGGLNGFWTHYIVSHSPSDERTLSLLEFFLLNQAPACLATRERFAIFKNEIKKHIREGCRFACVPSGMMSDLLDLDYSAVREFSLHGFDLDTESLQQAEKYAHSRGLLPHCTFLCKDAWSLEVESTFDLLTSNGLAIYEPDNDRVCALYREFYNALKPGGVFITSFLTPPPVPGCMTEWLCDRVDSEHALLQRILFVDILDVKWQVYRTEEMVKKQLQEAGFCDITICYDEAHIFPTVVCSKSSTATQAGR